jgi:hypothetical protein
MMNEQEYMQSRVDDQIQWYGARSAQAQRAYRLLQVFQIAGAAMVPFLSSYADRLSFIPVALGALGVLLALAGGLLALYQFHERWVEYRSTCEALKKEKYLYLTRSDPYDADSPFQLFVRRVEGLISRETATWAKANRPAKAQKAAASDSQA